ncbi:MAG: threonine synthase [Gammaproteobacteria bacterium]|nr:MAG: threonine synthase [Gammaproteobacteria bacterium]
MKYVSTRGQMPEKRFTEVLVMGLAPDGGLAVPRYIPQIDNKMLAAWKGLSYPDLAFEIFKLFIDDIPLDDLKTLIDNAYNKEKFGSDDITPLRYLDDNTAILGLSNGPTLAFKDIAMQMIGELFEYVLVRNNKKLNIIGATSGDTGSAAEHAMIGKSHINVFMLSPHGRMSPFQQAQMFGLDEANIFNIAVKGVFDDCQDIVKAINADAAFKEKYSIGAVNSINWARILAQVVYYFKGYFAAQGDNPGQSISFCVPSGNFGNVYAGFVARQMGLPIDQLIVATNENDVLNEFFTTHHYNVRPSAQVHETSSPSMDIGKASNFERYIYNLLDDDAEQLATLWEQLAQSNHFDMSDHADKIGESGFVSGKSSHQDRLATIQSVYQTAGDYIDPHTADGVFVTRQLQQTQAVDGLVICLETALPAKFEATLDEALGHVPSRPCGYQGIEDADKHVVIVDNSVAAVREIVEKNA